MKRSERHGAGGFKENVYDSSILEELFNIGPGGNFFFFVSLLTSSLPGARKAIGYGNAAFNIEEQTSLMNGQWDAEMAALRGKIQGFQQYEASNEIKIFEEAIKPLLKLNPDKYKDFMSIADGNVIDYPKFLTLLNILDTDIDTAKFLLDDMYDTMNEFNKSINKIVTDRIKESGRSQYDELTKNRRDIVAEAREKLKGKSLSATSRNLANAIEDFNNLKNTGTANYGELDALIEQMVLSGQKTMPISQTSTNLAKTNETRLQILQRIREYASAYQVSVNEMIQILRDTQKKIEEEESQEKINPREKEILKNLTVNIQQAINSWTIIENQWNQLEKILGPKNAIIVRQGRAHDQASGLTKNRREKIMRMLEKEGKNVQALQEFENEKKDIRNKENFQQYKAAIEQLLGLEEKSNIDDFIDKINIQLKKSEAAIRKQVITVVSETGGTLGLPFITDRINSAIGSRGLKVDGLTILVGKGIIDNVDPEISGINIQDLLSSELDKAASTLFGEVKTYNTGRDKKSNSYTSAGDIKASDKLDTTIIDKLKGSLTDTKKVTTILQDIFEIEYSIKFADTFTTIEHGFHGGSIGAGLEEGLKNINDMITFSGITPPDMSFLMSAIMNAGPGMLGYGQKNALEMYLSAIVAACMFSKQYVILDIFFKNIADCVI